MSMKPFVQEHIAMCMQLWVASIGQAAWLSNLGSGAQKHGNGASTEEHSSSVNRPGLNVHFWD
jgi:hypothetical protein